MLSLFCKRYLIPLISVLSLPCPIILFFFFKGHSWDTHAKVSKTCHVSNMDTTPQMKCMCFIDMRACSSHVRAAQAILLGLCFMAMMPQIDWIFIFFLERDLIEYWLCVVWDIDSALCRLLIVLCGSLIMCCVCSNRRIKHILGWFGFYKLPSRTLKL